MGAGLVSRHLFLILLLALSLALPAYAASQPGGGAQQQGCTCETKAVCGVPCDQNSECCSGKCQTTIPAQSPPLKTCVSCYELGAVCPAGTGCCNGLVCTLGKCKEPTTGGNTGNWYEGVYIWAGLAVVMAAAFLGLAYMAAKLFGVAVLEAWVKIELGELVKSMVIAVFCVTLIASANVASQFLIGDTGSTDVIAAAQDFMYTLYKDGQTLYMKLAVVYFNVAKVASYSYTAGTSLGGYATISYSSSPASGMSPLVSEVGQALDSVANYMLLAASQAAFLKFFGTAAVVMLPLGIFLRSFSFTRKLGGTLLAATIGAVVIYPSALLLSGQVYDTFATDMKAGFENVAVEDAKNPPSTEVVCNPFMQYFVQSPIPFLGGEIGWWIVVGTPICIVLSALSGGSGFINCMQMMYQAISQIFMLIKAIFPILLFASVFVTMESGTDADTLMANYYEPMQSAVLPAVAQFSIISLVTFLIPIIITLSLIRNLAASFGGEAQLYGLSKLV